MENKILIKVTIDATSDPEIYNLLTAINPRRRAERVRVLALDGLHKVADKLTPPQENNNHAKAVNKSTVSDLASPQIFSTGQDDFSQLSDDIAKNLG